LIGLRQGFGDPFSVLWQRIGMALGDVTLAFRCELLLTLTPPLRGSYASAVQCPKRS